MTIPVEAAALFVNAVDVEVFTSPGIWTWPGNNKQVRVLAVGGGGSQSFEPLTPGITNRGNGGGGGGAVVVRDIPVTSPLNITIGAGGTGSPSTSSVGGETTVIGASASVTAGGGGTYKQTTPPNGGGGGGGMRQQLSYPVTTVVLSQPGSRGSFGSSGAGAFVPFGGGGGGGAGGAAIEMNGGKGLYGFGGGGGAQLKTVTGPPSSVPRGSIGGIGRDGGGNGQQFFAPGVNDFDATSGRANSGGGAGGGNNPTSGGSGIVIIGRWK